MFRHKYQQGTAVQESIPQRPISGLRNVLPKPGTETLDWADFVSGYYFRMSSLDMADSGLVVSTKRRYYSEHCEVVLKQQDSIGNAPRVCVLSMKVPCCIAGRRADEAKRQNCYRSPRSYHSGLHVPLAYSQHEEFLLLFWQDAEWTSQAVIDICV